LALYMLLKQLLYAPNVWQNRFDDTLGLLIVAVAVVAILVHFTVRHIRPPIREGHH